MQSISCQGRFLGRRWLRQYCCEDKLKFWSSQQLLDFWDPTSAQRRTGFHLHSAGTGQRHTTAAATQARWGHSISAQLTLVFPRWRQRWKLRHWLLLDRMLQWEETDPVRTHALRCLFFFSRAPSEFGDCRAARHHRNPRTTLLALLPPSSYCFPQNPNLPPLAASQLQNPKWWFIPFLYGPLNVTWAKRTWRCCGMGSPCTAAVACWAVHALGKIQPAPSGLCWERHRVTLCVTVPGAALCLCPALLLRECRWALSQKTTQMEKLAWSPDRITSPYVFFRKPTVSLNATHDL